MCYQIWQIQNNNKNYEKGNKNIKPAVKLEKTQIQLVATRSALQRMAASFETLWKVAANLKAPFIP